MKKVKKFHCSCNFHLCFKNNFGAECSLQFNIMVNRREVFENTVVSIIDWSVLSQEYVEKYRVLF